MTDIRERILETLKPLFERAAREKLWFYFPYGDLWFSPKELKEQHEKGNMYFSAENWELKDPMTKLDWIDTERERLLQAKREMMGRMFNDE